MEISAGEQWNHFLNNIFQEFEHVFFSRTHYNIFHTPNNTWSGGLTFTRKFGIGRDSSQFMSRSFQLRNNCNKTFGSVSHYILYLLLCVETAIFSALSINTLRAYFGQLWIFLDFDSPSLVISKMPMERIDFEQRQYIKLFFHIFYRNKMTTRIKHHTTISKTWSIIDTYTRCTPFDVLDNWRAFHLSRQQLQKTLHTIKDTFWSLSLDFDTFWGNIQSVAFLIYLHSRIDEERDSAILFSISHCKIKSCGIFQFGSEELCNSFGLRCRSIERSVGRKQEATFLLLQRSRHWDDVYPFIVTSFRCGLCTAWCK